MEAWSDLYGVLQVHQDAEQAVIEGAYKNLCKKYHPDINPSPQAVQFMQKINFAYSVLRNPETRRKYHSEWLERARSGKYSTFRQTREQPEKPRWVHKQAYESVHDYFMHISRNDFKQAYTLISGIDKKRISLKTFIDWQESVSSSYTLGSYDIRVFKYFEHYKIDELGRFNAEEYTINVVEKDNRTSSVSEYSFSKVAILEKNDWRVYLGYLDLTSIINKFQCSGGTKKEADMLAQWEKYVSITDLVTELYNLEGFKKSLEVEIYRYNRYRTEFCVAVVNLSLPKKMLETPGYEQVLKHTAHFFKKSFRMTDIVGYTEEDTFAVILSSVSISTAIDVMRRVNAALKNEVGKCFDFKLKTSIGIVEYKGEDINRVYKNAKKISSSNEYMSFRFGNTVVKLRENV